jgi:hypothetical protein
LTAVGLVIVLAGTLLVGVHASKRDGEGYYASRAHPLGTPTRALVSDGLDVDAAGSDWIVHRGRLATIRVTATGTESRPIFVGIARKAQVAAYLHGVARDEISDLELDPFSVDRKRHVGAVVPPAPAEERFWSRSASGSGRQAIRWPVRKGNWAVVVMNADGSLGVHTKVGVSAKVPVVLWLGIGGLAVGAILLAVGGVGIYRGMRREPRPATTVTARPLPSTGGES